MINVKILSAVDILSRTVLPTTADTATVTRSSSVAGTATISVNTNTLMEFWERNSANRKSYFVSSTASNPTFIDLSLPGSIQLPPSNSVQLPTYIANRYLYTNGTDIFWSSTASTVNGGGGVTDPLVLDNITINGTGPTDGIPIIKTGAGVGLNIAGAFMQITATDSGGNAFLTALGDTCAAGLQAGAGGSMAGIYARSDGSISLTTGGTGSIGLDQTGVVDIAGSVINTGPNTVFRVQGGPNSSNTYPTSGHGFEIAYATDANYLGAGGVGTAVFQSYDRDASAWRDVLFAANDINFSVNGSSKLILTTSGIGFFGHSPASQQTGSGITTVAQLVSVLQAYGLLS